MSLKGVQMDDFEREVSRLSEGRSLAPADLDAVRQFAALRITAERARAEMNAEGITFLDGDVPRPHPAVAVEQKASQELARWVTARPDLFGEQKKQKAASGRQKFEGLRAVQ